MGNKCHVMSKRSRGVNTVATLKKMTAISTFHKVPYFQDEYILTFSFL